MTPLASNSTSPKQTPPSSPNRNLTSEPAVYLVVVANLLNGMVTADPSLPSERLPVQSSKTVQRSQRAYSKQLQSTKNHQKVSKAAQPHFHQARGGKK